MASKAMLGCPCLSLLSILERRPIVSLDMSFDHYEWLRWVDSPVLPLVNSRSLDDSSWSFLRRCSLVSISNSLTCFRKFSISWSCSLWYEETNLSPCEEASSESTLVSCPSCMWSSSLFCSLSNLLWPYDETLEWLPLEPIDPSLACGPSILGGDRLALCLQLSKRFLQMAVIVVPGLRY